MTWPREEASDEDVAAAQSGDEDAFTRLFRAIQPGLLRYATVLARDAAEDVCGEAWAQVCRDLGSFHGDLDGFKGWVARIARNRAIDRHRSQVRRPADPIPPEDMPDSTTSETAEDLALGRISTEAAIRAIAALPAAQAEAIMLRTVLGLDAKTAAAVLGRSPGAVRTATYRGLTKLADRYERPDAN